MQNEMKSWETMFSGQPPTASPASPPAPPLVDHLATSQEHFVPARADRCTLEQSVPDPIFQGPSGHLAPLCNNFSAIGVGLASRHVTKAWRRPKTYQKLFLLDFTLPLYRSPDTLHSALPKGTSTSRTSDLQSSTHHYLCQLASRASQQIRAA